MKGIQRCQVIESEITDTRMGCHTGIGNVLYF
jgi:hypothetical protein